jgi:type I pantothenate kinase
MSTLICTSSRYAAEMPDLSDLVDLLSTRPSGGRPYVVAITGGVAAGKSVLAAQLAEALGRRPERSNVEIVGTDGFLFDNATLEARGLGMRKGFPETYDVEGLRAALASIRSGPTSFPGYSHSTYDIDPALVRTLSPPDVLIVEGLGLHLDHGVDASGRRLIDVLIYLDAEPEHLEAWFTARLVALMLAARNDPTSFYARFLDLDDAGRLAFAKMVWTRINLPNLTDHISAARDLADIVVRKRADHAIEAIDQPPRH